MNSIHIKPEKNLAQIDNLNISDTSAKNCTVDLLNESGL